MTLGVRTSWLWYHLTTTHSCINLHNLDHVQAGSSCYMKAKTLQGYMYAPDKAKDPSRNSLNYWPGSQSSEGLGLVSQDLLLLSNYK